MKGIIYLMIANDSSPSPLGEVCLASGNFQLLSLKILSKLSEEKSTSKSYEYQKEFIFHYHNSKSISLICMTDHEYSNRFAYRFIYEVRDILIQDFGDDIKTALAFSLKPEYVSKLKTLMKNYNNPQSLDKIAVVNKNVHEVMDIMLENIEKLIARGEKIDALIVQSEELEANAKVFKKKADKACCFFCCQHLKWVFLSALLFLAILITSILLICDGPELSKCRKYISHTTP